MEEYIGKIVRVGAERITNNTGNQLYSTIGVIECGSLQGNRGY